MPSLKKNTPSVKGRQCGKCSGCTSPLCGKCAACKDKPQFGGPNRLKKGCMRRICTGLNTQDRKVPPSLRISANPSTPNKQDKKLQKVEDQSTPSKQRKEPPLSVKQVTGNGQNKVPPNLTNYSTLNGQGKEKATLEDKMKPVDVLISPVLEKSRTGGGISSNSPGKNVLQKSGSMPADQDTPSSPLKAEDFPFVNIHQMSKGDLSTLMMKLLKTLALKANLSLRHKPEWWPDTVEWGVTNSLNSKQLMDVIKQCYKAYGKENMLSPAPLQVYSQPVQPEFPKSATACRFVTLNPSPEVVPQTPLKSRGFPKELFLPFTVEIYICYFCEKEFVSKEKMRAHQKKCIERPPDLIQPTHHVPVMEFDRDISPPQISPKSTNLRVDVDRKYIPLKEFAGFFDLIPSKTASKMKAQRKCSEISSDILEEIEPMSPVPHTPRTPRSLISQLSRDEPGGVAKKRLSYSLSVDKDKVVEKEVFKKEEESSDSETEMETAKPKSTNLLNIPISSLLGQKIQKYVQVDTASTTLNNSESFCKTPTKNAFLEKLRKKQPSYPITYKPRRIAKLDKHCHMYKFNKLQLKEFMAKVSTGLNLESQGRFKMMKKLRIRLSRLTEKHILKWISRRTMDRQLYRKFDKLHPQNVVKHADEFPSGPTLLSKNIDKLLGLKRRTSIDNPALSLSNYVSEEMEVEVSKLQLALYKCLLNEVSVLKPTVMVTDVEQSQAENVDKHETSLSCQKTVKQSSSDISVIDGTNSKSLTSIPNRRILVRNNNLKGTEKKKKVHEQSEVCSTEEVTVNNLLSLSVPKNDKTCDKEPVIDKPYETSTPIPSTGTSIGKQIKSTVRRNLCSPDCKSHFDDQLSVISMSSDSETFTAECCLNCRGDGQNSSINGNQLGITSSCKKGAGDSKIVNKSNFMEPLTVSVEHNDPVEEKTVKSRDLSGIASCLTLASQSSVLSTPPSTPKKSTQRGDSVKMLDLSERSKPSTRSSSLLLKNANSSNDKEQLDDKVGRGLPLLAQTLMLTERVKDLQRQSRSKSLTPSTSSKKDSLKTSVSLPNTPQKNTVKKTTEKLVEKNGNSRILRGSQSRRSSFELNPTSDTKNLYSLKSGNFIVSSPLKVSPRISSKGFTVFKSNLQFNELSNRSPLTRGVKRLRSLEPESPSKRVKSQVNKSPCK